MSDLLALAARCEAAEGPDRELDFAIAEAIGLKLWVGRGQSVPVYTASLDAAMTLVPRMAAWRTTSWPKTGQAAAKVEHGPECGAATPALALCASALKARAAQ